MVSCGNNNGVSCGFFTWHDPPMCTRSREIIPGLLRRINTAEAQVNRGKKKEKMFGFLLIASWMILFAFVMGWKSG